MHPSLSPTSNKDVKMVVLKSPATSPALPPFPFSSLPILPPPSLEPLPWVLAAEKKWSSEPKTWDVREEIFRDFKEKSPVTYTSEYDDRHWDDTNTPANQLIWSLLFSQRKESWPIEQAKEMVCFSPLLCCETTLTIISIE